MRALALLIFVLVTSFLFSQDRVVIKSPSLGSGYEYENNGKLDSVERMSRVFVKGTDLNKVFIANKVHRNILLFP